MCWTSKTFFVGQTFSSFMSRGDCILFERCAQTFFVWFCKRTLNARQGELFRLISKKNFGARAKFYVLFEKMHVNSNKHCWRACFRKAIKTWHALQNSPPKWNEKVYCFRLTKPVLILSSILSHCERHNPDAHILCAQNALACFHAHLIKTQNWGNRSRLGAHSKVLLQHQT